MPSPAGRADPFNPWVEGNGAATHQEYASWLGLALALPLLRFFLHRLVLKRLAQACLASVKAQPSQKRQQLETKFSESLWKVVLYSTVLTIGLYAVSDEPWLQDTSFFWKDWPQQVFSQQLLFLYRIYFATCASDLLMLVLWDTRRNDFWAMLIHHVATLFLVMLSYYLGFLRVGSMIMILHFPSDILLDLAKLFNYADWEQTTTVLFVVFMASWVLTRLIYFPFWIVWSTSFEVEQVLGFKPHLYTLFNGLLLLLVVLHIYWFAIICNVALEKVLHGKPVEDARETDA